MIRIHNLDPSQFLKFEHGVTILHFSVTLLNDYITLQKRSVSIYYLKRCCFLGLFFTLLIQFCVSIFDPSNMSRKLVTNDTCKSAWLALAMDLLYCILYSCGS